MLSPPWLRQLRKSFSEISQLKRTQAETGKFFFHIFNCRKISILHIRPPPFPITLNLVTKILDSLEWPGGNPFRVYTVQAAELSCCSALPGLFKLPWRIFSREIWGSYECCERERKAKSNLRKVLFGSRINFAFFLHPATSFAWRLQLLSSWELLTFRGNFHF